MNIKKFIAVLFVLVFFSLAAVSATDIHESTVTESPALSSDSLDVDNAYSKGDAEKINLKENSASFSESNHNEEITAKVMNQKVDEPAIGSFSEFQQDIYDAVPGSTLNLKKDYHFQDCDKELNDKEGIIINKNLVINGHGHAFNGETFTRIFQSKTGNITLIDIYFIGGQLYQAGKFDNDEDDGAIKIKGDAQYTIINCTFDRNAIHGRGGAIFNDGGKMVVKRTIFKNNSQEAKSVFTLTQHGGAIYSSKHLYVEDCVFIENKAGDNGGAIYAEDGLELIGKNIFEGNWVYYKGGAIYTNKFTKNVSNGIFINNIAGKDCAGSDDARAIYINNANDVTFSYCLFWNNKCTDEGGAIYLDSTGSTLSLINNIFIANHADDEGKSVFNKGKYGTVKNNWWGEDLIIFDNILTEWHSGKSNENHYDEDPLKLRLTIGATEIGIDSPVIIEAKFINSHNELFNGKLLLERVFELASDKKGKFDQYAVSDSSIQCTYTASELGKHKIYPKNLYNDASKALFGYITVSSALPDYNAQVIENTDLSFRDLQEMIDQANPGTTIHLNRNYIYHRGDNTLNNKEGIKINKDITIDGHGHSIHAQWASGIFQSTEGAIKIMNTIFKYGNQRNADDGGALRILENAQYTIINCTFDSNLANQDGGAIFNTGGNLYISDSTFINNRGHGANKLNDCDGGAIHTTNATGGITIRGNPTIFEANTAYNGKGGAIFTNMFDADVNNATFNGNRAGDGATISDDGGAIYQKQKQCHLQILYPSKQPLYRRRRCNIYE